MERILSRRQQRIWTLQALYEADFHSADADEVLDNLLEREPEAGQADYTKLLVPLVLTHREQIDSSIAEHAIDWRLDRMSRVDLNILRIAAAEMLFIEDVADSVAINEAIELAKEYSTPKSGKFINGILGALSQTTAQS